ncbi:hypothetical protein F7725_023800 [Dissostichus mawsoni]|uniref:Uncharacterized protein n=1 Tax=Dissostichus mawsoni TaxID=36200 RepID=A0A7J5XZ39_DISMA|nr:hypothetical protein F7725_023800 [Dissostichus mawsoni]
MSIKFRNPCDWLDKGQIFPTASLTSVLGIISVTESFLQYVSTQEREILELALKSFNSVEKDDLLDVLDAHDCQMLATEGNIAGLVSQLGHKSLIQTPMFVIDCWKPILKTLADTLYPQTLVEIVEERIPTPNRVKDLLEYPKEMTAPLNTVARHLRKYIGESDNTTLKAFPVLHRG